MRKSLKETYSEIRAAIAFILRKESVSKHTITEAAIAATRAIYEVGKTAQ